MIVQAKIRLYIPCPNCTEGRHRADQLNVGQPTTWTCDQCHWQFHIERLNGSDFETTPGCTKDTPVTVTLRSDTEPPITVKINVWRYASSQGLSKEDYESDERYFYNEHTCPTNWLRDIVGIEFEGDRDPHGVFQFVSVEDGHFVDPD